MFDQKCPVGLLDRKPSAVQTPSTMENPIKIVTSPKPERLERVFSGLGFRRDLEPLHDILFGYHRRLLDLHRNVIGDGCQCRVPSPYEPAVSREIYAPLRRVVTPEYCFGALRPSSTKNKVQAFEHPERLRGQICRAAAMIRPNVRTSKSRWTGSVTRSSEMSILEQAHLRCQADDHCREIVQSGKDARQRRLRINFYATAAIKNCLAECD